MTWRCVLKGVSSETVFSWNMRSVWFFDRIQRKSQGRDLKVTLICIILEFYDLNIFLHILLFFGVLTQV